MKGNGEIRAEPLARGRGDRPPSLVEVAKDAADNLLDLLTAQIKLARLELSADLGTALRQVVRLALFIPPLVVGYAFAMAAAASWLGDMWGRTAGLAAVAGFQIAAAGIGLLSSVAALKRARLLQRAGADMANGVQRTIAAVSEGTSVGSRER